MDLMAVYAEKYGGVPRDDQSWHEVLALAQRVEGFDARARLTLIDAQQLSRPADSAGSAMRQMQLAKLQRLAEFKKR